MKNTPFILSVLPLLVLPGMADELIISNNGKDPATITNNIVHPTGNWTASNVSAKMQDVLFVKTTPNGTEEFGNGASLSSVACSLGGSDTFDYSLTWTTQVSGASGSDRLNLNKISVDWALLRLHNNTIVYTVTYDGEGVLHNYGLSFNYELSSADGSQYWKSDTPITVTINRVGERDRHMCANSCGIYTDGVNFGDTEDTIMSAARSEIVFGPEAQVQLFDDTTYTLHLTLAGITDLDTGLPFDLDEDIRTRYGWGVAHELTYAAVGNVALSAEVSPSPVPEPATATISLLALSGLAARRRRKA